MMQGMYSAAAGVKTQQSRIDVIADNMSNVSTTGFKATRMDFKDALYSQMKLNMQSQQGNNMQLGHGALVSNTTRYFTPGNIQTTGNLTDIALEGDGFLTVLDESGGYKYTRNGSLSVSSETTGNYLVTGNGEYVADANGNRIQLNGNLDDLVIGADGSISFGAEEPFARLGLVKFPNNEGLSGVGQTSFVPTEASGQPIAATTDDVMVRQGAAESSNVDMAEEMTRLIRTQRAMQLSSRGITTADDMESAANNMRR